MRFANLLLLDLVIVLRSSEPDGNADAPTSVSTEHSSGVIGPSVHEFPKIYVGSLNEVRDNQLRYDAEQGFRFPPRLELSLLEESPMGALTIGPGISRTRYSTVFLVGNYPEWVIKYQIETAEDFEDELGLPMETEKGLVLHQLFRDYYFQGIASRLNISPVPHFVSGPAEVGAPGICGSKCNFDVDAATKNAYHEKRYIVRYLVMDKLESSINSLILNSRDSRRVSLYEGVAIGKQMIRILQRLHDDGGIIHADIHSGNFMLSKDKQVRLIDFGKAFLATDIAVIDAMHESQPFVEGNNPLYSPWEMSGFTQSKRDDVFKAILTFAHIVIGTELMNHLRKNISKPNICMHLKTSGELFFYPFVNADPLSNTDIKDPLKVRNIRASFREIAMQAIAPQHIGDRPHYEEILGQMDSILDLVTPPHT